MRRTPVRLADDSDRELQREATASRMSKAGLLRSGARAGVETVNPRPKLPLFSDGPGDIAERVEELLAGFGES